ncbi:MAG: hypothetical protein IPG63_00405 [Xanthomonadales bacterium]|nr:hypothetical protein [Xanthomonadales bacterium]
MRTMLQRIDAEHDQVTQQPQARHGFTRRPECAAAAHEQQQHVAAFVVANIDRGAACEQGIEAGGTGIVGRGHQRRLTGIVARVDVGTSTNDLVEQTMHRRIRCHAMQQRLSDRADVAHVDSRSEQLRERRGILETRRQMRGGSPQLS